MITIQARIRITDDGKIELEVPRLENVAPGEYETVLVLDNSPKLQNTDSMTTAASASAEHILAQKDLAGNKLKLKSAKYFTPEEIELNLQKIFTQEELAVAETLDFDKIVLPVSLSLSELINQEREDRF